MEVVTETKHTRRPRFRRASEPPAFRLTENDIEIVRQIAHFRFIGSDAIAELVGRSIDRTNDRLMRLYHAGYIDRPRAQLDRFPTAGSGRFVYALADRGARLLREHDGASFSNLEWGRKNREAGRPFIEHQIEIVEFQVALERAIRERSDVQLLHPRDILAAAPTSTRDARSPFRLRARISQQGQTREVGVIPDFVFGLKFPDGSRRCFMVEIDRGTMPVSRAGIDQTSFERKMRVYATAHAAGQHQRQFCWKTFRLLTITSDARRMASMLECAKSLRGSGGSAATLYFFATFDDGVWTNPIEHAWTMGTGLPARLI
jgi:hypothetical protein